MTTTTSSPLPIHTMGSSETINKMVASISKEMNQLNQFLHENPQHRVDVKDAIGQLSSMIHRIYTTFYEQEPPSNHSKDEVFTKTQKLIPNSVLVPDSLETECQVDNGKEPNIWSGFYNKTLRERQDLLNLMYPKLFRRGMCSGSWTVESNKYLHEISTEYIGELPIQVANLMVENCIGVLGLPLGLGLNFVIDNKFLVVPMAIEEPSVIAAASSAAKLISAGSDGFRTWSSGNIMTAQIHYTEVEDCPAATEAILQRRQELLDFANQTLCQNMVKRGGGALDLYVRTLPNKKKTGNVVHSTSWYTSSEDELWPQSPSESSSILVVHVDIDVCEAMGANIANTVAEGISNEITPLVKGKCGLRILTNLCVQRRTRSQFRIPVSKIGWKGMDGELVARKIVDAYDFALNDPFRACTHNKGIMNGVDAVAIATGQDWRAIEAAAHAYASRSGHYRPLTHYEIRSENNEQFLVGTLELPIAVGTKGGALQTHPGYFVTHALLKHPTSTQLSGIITSVGLAQNFSALRALAVTGIQKGHMALHARNIAVAAGVPSELVADVCAYMHLRGCINTEAACSYLRAHRIYSELHAFTSTNCLSHSFTLNPTQYPAGNTTSLSPSVAPSMLYAELAVPNLNENISINVAFKSLGQAPDQLVIVPGNQNIVVPPLQTELLGDTDFAEICQIFTVLDRMKLRVVPTNGKEPLKETTCQHNLILQNKLKLISILLNVIVYRLSSAYPDMTQKFVSTALECDTVTLNQVERGKLFEQIDVHHSMQRTGFPLFLSLWQVFQYLIEQEVIHEVIATALLTEQKAILYILSQKIENISGLPTTLSIENKMKTIMTSHTKRWQASIFLLTDALGFPQELLTPESVEFISSIGSYLEWEGTIAHDSARLRRAVKNDITPEANVVLYWIELTTGIKCTSYDKTQELIPLFQTYAKNQTQSMWNQIREKQDKESLKLFDLTCVTEIVDAIHAHYGVLRDTLNE